MSDHDRLRAEDEDGPAEPGGRPADDRGDAPDRAGPDRPDPFLQPEPERDVPAGPDVGTGDRRDPTAPIGGATGHRPGRTGDADRADPAGTGDTTSSSSTPWAPEGVGTVTTRRRRVDPIALAAGLVALWAAGFFWVVDDPSLRDQAEALWPAVLIVAGVALVVGTARRR